MFRRNWFYAAFGAVAALVNSAWGGHRAKTKPPCLDGIPGANYKFGPKPNVLVALSSVGIPAQKNDGVLNSILFQWPLPKYVIDQCSVSNLAVMAHPNGSFTLSLRADQNPAPPDATKAPYNPNLHIRRNLFTIELTGFATANSSIAIDQRLVGQPAIAESGPIEFWVENGQPKEVQVTKPWKSLTGFGTDGLAQARALNVLDRMQLTFQYC